MKAISALIAVLALAPATAQASVTAWDGANPFVCTLQHAGTGTAVPDPRADPYCVEFEKRHQNVDQLGVVDFLSKEPARVAAASPKCFYFQSDHWRGSVVQDSGATKTYEWDGHYFFDKARGDGGAWVTNFNVAGHTGDPSSLPGMPADWSRYFGPGTGGVIASNDVPVDAACASRAAANPKSIYASASAPPPTPSPAPPQSAACLRPSGALGPVAPADSERRARALLGDPYDVRDGFLRYCVHGGGEYLVGLDDPGSGPLGRDQTSVACILATTHAYRVGRLHPGAPARGVRGVTLLRLRRLRVLAPSAQSRALIGIARGRVRFVGAWLRPRRGAAPALKSLLLRAGL